MADVLCRGKGLGMRFGTWWNALNVCTRVQKSAITDIKSTIESRHDRDTIETQLEKQWFLRECW